MLESAQRSGKGRPFSRCSLAITQTRLTAPALVLQPPVDMLSSLALDPRPFDTLGKSQAFLDEELGVLK